MKIFVRVIPNARADSIEKIGEGRFIVRLKEPARENRANLALLELVSDYLRVPKREITIVSGARARDKILKIG